ncbi:hypothetical protein NF742_02545 [Kurthia gibsonii]|nr:hypothetical protein [Kurthia sp. 11kri321]MEB6112038.1 hypothetical protein [Kurthia gibsonii]MEB7771276.1 hypothetical protein [Kurthia gibsonii]
MIGIMLISTVMFGLSIILS